MEHIDDHRRVLAAVPLVQDWLRSRPRIVRLDSTTYGVRDRDGSRWHWVHRASAEHRWTCCCAQGRSCSHVEHVHQERRDRELSRAV